MKRYISNLKERPAHEKRRLSLRAAGVITAAVFFVWFSTLGVRLSSFSPENSAKTAETAAGLVAATAAAGAQFQNQFGEAKAGLTAEGQASAPQAHTASSAPATVLTTQ